jgi:hypothetical protein
MKAKSCCVLVITLVASSAVAEGSRGAKAIFVDTTSGAVVSGGARQPEPRPAKRSKTRTANGSAPARTVAPQVAGLMYYLELVSASGQRSRVTADSTFHSGDRILVHVVSSTDGDLAVFQHDPDGTISRLFPDTRVNGGSAFIARNVDTTVPSPTSWFRFDDQTGTERLSVVLTPRGRAAPPRPSATMTTAALSEFRSGAGSKGLLLETENSGPEQATYVVRPMQDDRAAEPLIVEITLKHQ